MPLKIIIDGYNLMGIYHKDLEKEREILINKLIKYSQLRKHQILIIFDGHKSENRTRKLINRGSVKILYTACGESADEFIYSFLQSLKDEWVVVSSDRSIQKEAWASRAIPLRAEDFERILERYLKDERAVEYNCEVPEKEDHYEDRKKSVHLSKKEKVLLRIMKKL
ncbi:MAG: NYN domain-containing protein [Thermodesulfovibrionales bacterium]|nr:NYN domain-containing protein [Thermodesulfovibrionales bacterium]